MKSLILYLKNKKIEAAEIQDFSDKIRIEDQSFLRESVYFGDWISLRNAFNKIIGFKIVPLVKDDYLQRNVFHAAFVTKASNVKVEKRGGYPYLSIFLLHASHFTEFDMNQIEATIFLNGRGDFVIKLEGFSEQDWQELGFPVKLLA